MIFELLIDTLYMYPSLIFGMLAILMEYIDGFH